MIRAGLLLGFADLVAETAAVLAVVRWRRRRARNLVAAQRRAGL